MNVVINTLVRVWCFMYTPDECFIEYTQHTLTLK